MSLFQSENPKEEKHSGILGAFSVDNIKWEPEDDGRASLVAFRYPFEDFPNGSYLHVAQSQMAVFTNNLTAGNSLENTNQGASQVSVFLGPCKIQLTTGDSRFAPFRNVSHKLTGGSSAYHSTVYFINTNYMNELRWGTSDPILVQDPEEEVNIHVRAYGLFGAHIEQSDTSIASVQARKFLTKVVGTRGKYSQEELTNYMRAKILEYVPDMLAKAIVDKNISVLKIATHLSEFSGAMQGMLRDYFDEFGLTLDNFSFNSIKPFEEDLAALNAMKIERKSKILEAEGTAAQMDIESEAMARKREREGYTYQQERGMDVMQGAAMNEGGGQSGLMGAGMGLGMGVGLGGAFGAGMSQLANQTMGSIADTTMGGAYGGNLHNLIPFQRDANGNYFLSTNQTDGIECPICGTMNGPKAKFCSECGAKIEPAAACPSCGTINQPGAKFCSKCGTRLGAAQCPNCQAELEPGAKFCPNCGTKLN